MLPESFKLKAHEAIELLHRDQAYIPLNGGEIEGSVEVISVPSSVSSIPAVVLKWHRRCYLNSSSIRFGRKQGLDFPSDGCFVAEKELTAINFFLREQMGWGWGVGWDEFMYESKWTDLRDCGLMCLNARYVIRESLCRSINNLKRRGVSAPLLWSKAARAAFTYLSHQALEDNEVLTHAAAGVMGDGGSESHGISLMRNGEILWKAGQSTAVVDLYEMLRKDRT